MRLVRWSVVAQCAAAAAAVLAAGGPSLLTAVSSVPTVELVATVFAGGAVLAALSVWLPRGDAVDNSAALAFVAGVYLAPEVSAVIMAAAWLLGMVLSGRGMDFWRALEQMSRRALLMAGTYAAVGFAARTFYGGVSVLGPNGAPVALRTLESGFALLRVLGPDFGTASTNRVPILILVGAAGVVFVALDLLLEQLQSSIRLSTPYAPIILSAVRLRGLMVVAEMSVAVLTVTIYPSLGPWGAAISTGMLVVMRRSFVLLRDMQSSYEITIEVLARSLDWSDPARRGHAERVANMVATAARRIGFGTKRLEDVRYAALFHDVARMGSDEADSDAESSSSEVLADVNVLAGALPLLQMLDTGGHVSESPDEEVVIGAYLIARFSDIDDAVNVGVPTSPSLGNAIGARLYASTRLSAERIIRDVERTMPGRPTRQVQRGV
jgi:hypothetical protein